MLILKTTGKSVEKRNIIFRSLLCFKKKVCSSTQLILTLSYPAPKKAGVTLLQDALVDNNQRNLVPAWLFILVSFENWAAALPVALNLEEIPGWFSSVLCIASASFLCSGGGGLSSFFLLETKYEMPDPLVINLMRLKTKKTCPNSSAETKQWMNELLRFLKMLSKMKQNNF